MNSLVLLLAQRDNWERLGDKFSGRNAKVDPGEIVAIFLCLAGVVVLVWLLHRFAKWQEGATRRPNPGRLFRDLCRAHRLNHWERGVVQAVAHAAGARQPAEAFVRPDMFLHVSPAAASKPVAFEQLRRKLFPELS